MSEENIGDNFVIDGMSYEKSELSDEAKQQIENIRFVDAQLLQLTNELAIADTARIGYTNALKSTLPADSEDE